MVVQFNCPGCGQPIEVDGEWAEKTVGCPFCQQMVTAPAASTLASEDAAGVNMARPTMGHLSAPVVEKRSILPTVGLILALGAIVALIIGGVIFAGFMTRNQLDTLSTDELVKKLQSMVTDPANASTFAAVGLLYFLSFTLWLAGLVVSIVVLVRTRPKPLAAVAGLGISTILPMFMVLPLFLGG